MIVRERCILYIAALFLSVEIQVGWSNSNCVLMAYTRSTASSLCLSGLRVCACVRESVKAMFSMKHDTDQAYQNHHAHTLTRTHTYIHTLASEMRESRNEPESRSNREMNMRVVLLLIIHNALFNEFWLIAHLLHTHTHIHRDRHRHHIHTQLSLHSKPYTAVVMAATVSNILIRIGCSWLANQTNPIRSAIAIRLSASVLVRFLCYCFPFSSCYYCACVCICFGFSE